MEIEGYENYLIYNDGRLQNKKTKRFLKQSRNSDGYLMIDLYNQGFKKCFKIHRLVAKYYCINEKPEEYNTVDHIDRNKINNHYTNLRWCNQLINMQNTGFFSNNTTGYKNISFCKNVYVVKITRNKDTYYKKGFKTIEEAIKYRDELLSSFN